jgi:hypothetical protein
LPSRSSIFGAVLCGVELPSQHSMSRPDECKLTHRRTAETTRETSGTGPRKIPSASQTDGPDQGVQETMHRSGPTSAPCSRVRRAPLFCPPSAASRGSAC